LIFLSNKKQETYSFPVFVLYHLEIFFVASYIAMCIAGCVTHFRVQVEGQQWTKRCSVRRNKSLIEIQKPAQ